MRLTALLLAAGVGGALWSPEPRPLASAHFMDGPPVRSSGGFGEPSCIDCHWGADLNDAQGTFFFEGIPEAYRPGGTYEIAVVLTRPGMAVGGFQMAVRFEADGAQAGTLELPAAEEGRVSLVDEQGVTYAQQLLTGMELVAPDTARWTIRWTAPAEPGRVLFHASGNVGDGDDSQIGDYAYVAEAASEGR